MSNTFKTVLISSAVAILAFAGGTTYTNNKLSNAMDEVVNHILSQPKVNSFDAVALTRKLMDEGLPPQEVVTYMEKYINVHKSMNIMLIDSKYTIAEPQISKAMTLTREELDALASKHKVEATINYKEIMAEYEAKALLNK